GLGEPGVVVVVVGVAGEVAPVGPARVEVADALVVGQEVHPLADPHRRRQVAVELYQATELPVAALVDPQLACRAAPVPLPPGGVGGVATEDDGAGGTEGDLARRPVRQLLG